MTKASKDDRQSIQSKGGHARAAGMTKQERIAQSKAAAKARWDKVKQLKPDNIANMSSE